MFVDLTEQNFVTVKNLMIPRVCLLTFLALTEKNVVINVGIIKSIVQRTICIHFNYTIIIIGLVING